MAGPFFRSTSSSLPFLLLLVFFLSCSDHVHSANDDRPPFELDPEVLKLQEADRVKDLPDQPPVNFRHYAGYIPVEMVMGHALFYWFFEAESDVENKPLLLWLTGEPACSSIGYGMAEEHGPFTFQKGSPNLKLNQHSWNKDVNIIYLDSPVGVGFSYSNETYDLTIVGDRISAEDSYAFIKMWFERFPQFKYNDFYIAGEALAGHFAPQLSERILAGNKKNTSKENQVNLKGFMIGNPWLDTSTDLKGMIDYAWDHAVISDRLYYDILHSCNTSLELSSLECDQSLKRYLEVYDTINMYSLYYSTDCVGPNNTMTSRFTTTRPSRIKGVAHISPAEIPRGKSNFYDPCIPQYIETYFNRPDVQKSLHANGTEMIYPWTRCSIMIPLWHDLEESVLPRIRRLISAGLRIWIYSGDTDATNPVTSTRLSLQKLGLATIVDWHPWYLNKQLAGWSILYDGLTFVTVHGAGLQVPKYAPYKARQLLLNFLANKQMPQTPH